MSPEFLDLLRTAVRRFPKGKQQACAEAIGISPQHLSATLRKRRTNAFNIVNCLRLAQVLNVSASRVLRAAGHADAAELIERLYPPSTLLPEAAGLHTDVAQLPTAARGPLIQFLQIVATAKFPPPPRRPKKR